MKIRPRNYTEPQNLQIGTINIPADAGGFDIFHKSNPNSIKINLKNKPSFRTRLIYKILFGWKWIDN